MTKKLAYIFLLVSTAACGSLKPGKKLPKRLSDTEYLSWYGSKNYPFRDTVSQNNILYVCTAVPREVAIARQFNAQLISSEEAQSILKEPNELFEFQLEIILPQTGTDVFHYKLRDDESVSSRTTYFSFGIKKDLGIKYQHLDTLDCASLHFEKGISNFPVSRIMAYFPLRNEALQSITFNPRIFGGSHISFDLKDLTPDNLPKLKL